MGEAVTAGTILASVKRIVIDKTYWRKRQQLRVFSRKP
jgi:hypothetical protein